MTNPGLLGTGMPYGISRRSPLVGGTPPAVRTGGCVGVGVGGGGGGGMGGMSGGTTFSLGLCFFPVVPFCPSRRGVGEARGCAIELPSLLKKSPIGSPATAKSPAARNPATKKIETIPLRRNMSVAIVHHMAGCSTSAAIRWPGHAPSGSVRTAQRAVPTAVHDEDVSESECQFSGHP